MYKGDVPKRPLNYGFGVKQSDIFGVQGLIREKASSHMTHNVVEVENLKAELSEVKKQNQALENKFDETTQTFKIIASQFAHVLKEVRSGNASAQLLDAAESAIHFIDTQVFTTQLNFPFATLHFLSWLCDILMN